jgi:acetyl coenzyme A synthetase (ADP forming)-like protein
VFRVKNLCAAINSGTFLHAAKRNSGMDPMALAKLFNPSSVAVIGASQEEGKLGHEILRNLIQAGCKASLYPVNPKASEILGLKAYPRVDTVPGKVEMAVIVVPAKFVPEVMGQCANIGVKAAVIISGGFREVGADGEELEKALAEIAAKGGIRVIGPNCQGINNPHSGLCATWPLVTRKGPIAVITQSGTVGAAMSCWAEQEGIGISKCVALGNRIDVNECDLIEYFCQESNTHVIAVYVEGVADGQRFIQVCSSASRKKPIVVLKPGRTAAGVKAVQSHTKSLAGRDEVFDAVCRKTGIIRVDTVEQLLDAAKALAFLSPPKGNGTLIVTSSGGSGILASDTAQRLGFDLPEPDKDAKQRLAADLPSQCVLSNPFDLTMTTADKYELVIKETAKDLGISSFVAIFGDPIPSAAEAIDRARKSTDKPIVVVYLGGSDTERIERSKMHEIGIPVFSSPERGVTALHALLKYSRSLGTR